MGSERISQEISGGLCRVKQDSECLWAEEFSEGDQNSSSVEPGTGGVSGGGGVGSRMHSRIFRVSVGTNLGGAASFSQIHVRHPLPHRLLEQLW